MPPKRKSSSTAAATKPKKPARKAAPPTRKAPKRQADGKKKTLKKPAAAPAPAPAPVAAKKGLTKHAGKSEKCPSPEKDAITPLPKFSKREVKVPPKKAKKAKAPAKKKTVAKKPAAKKPAARKPAAKPSKPSKPSSKAKAKTKPAAAPKPPTAPKRVTKKVQEGETVEAPWSGDGKMYEAVVSEVVSATEVRVRFTADDVTDLVPVASVQKLAKRGRGKKKEQGAKPRAKAKKASARKSPRKAGYSSALAKVEAAAKEFVDKYGQDPSACEDLSQLLEKL